MVGMATEKACKPRFSLVLGQESCCEGDDLSCLGMFDRCNATSMCIRTCYGVHKNKLFKFVQVSHSIKQALYVQHSYAISVRGGLHWRRWQENAWGWVTY